MTLRKIGCGLASVALIFAVSTSAFAEGVTVSSAAECTAQDGSVMDLQGVSHCLVPVVPEEFQGVEYAGEIKGVHACKKKTRAKHGLAIFASCHLRKNQLLKLRRRPCLQSLAKLEI